MNPGLMPLIGIGVGKAAPSQAPARSSLDLLIGNQAKAYDQAAAPDQTPEWQRRLEWLSAGMADVGAAMQGRESDQMGRVRERRAAMRETREEARARQQRFEQLRNIFPSSDREFWEAYALGGEQAAMQVYQRRNAPVDPVTLGRGETLVDPRTGAVVAENANAPGDEPAIIQSLRAANVPPEQWAGIVREHYGRTTGDPSLGDMAARLVAKVARGEELTPAEQAAWQQIMDYRMADPMAAFTRNFMGGAGAGAIPAPSSPSPLNDDPLGLGLGG